jgi:hypothetical protein
LDLTGIGFGAYLLISTRESHMNSWNPHMMGYLNLR